METLEIVFSLSIIIIILFYFINLKIENTRWHKDESEAIYKSISRFFKKRNYEVCKIDIVKESLKKSKLKSSILQEYTYTRLVVIMDSKRNKYETIIKVKKSFVFGTSVNLIRQQII
ncbi:hypothetical protein BTO05_04910 [Winogradskyella sp. PC-19]|uniref:hypothetical protein n=1 Tax=unclassified Winogradskyella TaxID=2615021 RepID=UPI000B3C28E2|nr:MULTISPECIES: hypothetical protein [unclassified Winogradskyella]ARV09005.1 hypothetical protein BTO05_04910 [Winogradskyella sp. PC-19]